VLYVDDKFPRHPKIFKAGSMLGLNGPAQAVALYLDGLSYAREHLTDGYLPEEFVRSSALVSKPYLVAKALCNRGVRLWHRVPGGYQIHDYHDWNRTANEIKEKRAAERLKKQRQRGAISLGARALSRDMSPGDNSRTSRARASTNHVPLRRKITAADAAARVQISTSFAQLCMLAHYAAEGLGDPAEPGQVAEEVKWACAAAHFEYPRPDELTAAVDAVLTARAKGYRTPREHKAAAS